MTRRDGWRCAYQEMALTVANATLGPGTGGPRVAPGGHQPRARR